MEKYLSSFCHFEISKSQLQKEIGEDLHNIKCKKAYSIKCSDIINAIQLFQNSTIDISALVEWVNVIWFTELFVFDDNETDSIVSVLEILETMDEEGIVVSEKEFSNMITALTSNAEYIPV